MGRSVRSWPIVGRAFRRASISPVLAAALSFSLVLTLVGSAAFVAAVPGLAAESPLVREFVGDAATNLVLGGPLSATDGASPVDGVEEGAFDAVGSSIDSNASAGAVSKGGSTSSGFAGNVGAGSPALPEGALSDSPGLPTDAAKGDVPASAASAKESSGTPSQKNPSSKPSSSEKKTASSSGSSNAAASSGEQSPSSGNQGSGSNQGQSGASSGASTTQDPEPDPAPVLSPEEGGPVPEDMELRIRDALRSEFDILDSYADQVSDCVDDYNRLSLTDPKAPRQAAARKVDKLLRNCQVSGAHVSETMRIACGMQQEYGGMWATSRYIDNYVSLQHCYGSLENLLYQLSNAWSGNCYFDVPSEHVDYWGDRVTINKKTGKMKYLEEYETNRKGARP